MRQQHDGQVGIITRRRLGELLQGRAALFAGFSAGYADLGDLLVGEQAQGPAGREHRAPVKVRTHHGMRCALPKTLGAGGGADLVQTFQLQKRVVAVQDIQAFGAARQMGLKLLGAELHGRLGLQPFDRGHAPQQLLHDVALHVAVQQDLLGLFGQYGGFAEADIALLR